MHSIFTRLHRRICVFVFSISLLQVSAQPSLTYTPLVSGLDFPVDLVNAGDDRLFIVEQNGLIKLYKAGVVTTFLDLVSIVDFTSGNDERGLLSMAFHPGYNGTSNRFFFVYYTTTSASITTIRVVRYTTLSGNPDVIDPADLPDEVIAIPKPSGRTNHNGGKLNFGADGMLYFGTGDGGSSDDPNNLAQNGNSLLGKMLRIDINGSTGGTPFYSIPPDNPYVGAGGNLDEIWAIGLRNPFRWSFDPVTGAMWIADVGQGQREEVNVRFPSPTTGAVNYGWRCWEGTLQNTNIMPQCDPPDDVFPVFEYGHNFATGGFSITGGVVYRGTGSPLLYGYYVFADYVSGNVWVRSESGTVTQQPADRSNVAAFGLDEDGELYAVARGGTTLGAGVIYRVTAPFSLPVTLVSFTGNSSSGYNELNWATSYEQNADRYIIEYSTDGINFAVAGEVVATNNPTGSNYSYRHLINSTEKLFYRLLMRDLDASSRYSSIIAIGGKNTGEIKIHPTLIRNNMLELTTSKPVERLHLFDTGGREVFSYSLNNRQGYFSIPLPGLRQGVYFVRVLGRDYSKTEKIIIQ